MRRSLLASVLVLSATLFLYSANKAILLEYPDIHGNRIVFTYNDDLWMVNVQGGIAYRLTSAPGKEYRAKFSPDGKWIAFNASYDGVDTVYVMPSEGGTPRRVVFNPGRNEVIGWSTDGKILFRSDFQKFNRWEREVFATDIKGSYPEKLPVGRAVLLTFSPDGKKVAFNDRGREEYYWHRYKGGQYMRIWLADLRSRQFKLLTKYKGKNAYPMWIGGKIFFVSDRWEGISNLFSIDPKTGKVQQHTFFKDFDINFPSTDGKKIVFVKGGKLYLFDPETGEVSKIEVRVADDRWKLTRRTINPKKYIHYADVTSDGKYVVLEARGDLFLVDVKKGDALNLTKSPGSREMYPTFSPDGKKIAFFSDRTGEYQLYLMDVKERKSMQLTHNLKTFPYHLEWSPDGKKILFSTKDLEIWLLDLQTRELRLIDRNYYLKNDEFSWEMSDYSWSPDGRWIAFSKTAENRNNVIYLYDTLKNKKYSLTDDFFDNYNPVFDPEGNFLFFLSNRNFEILVDYLEDNHVLNNTTKLMVVQLRKGEAPPFEEKTLEERLAGEKEGKKKKSFRIDLDGIRNRIFEAPLSAGNYFFLKAAAGKLVMSYLPFIKMRNYDFFFVIPDVPVYYMKIFDLESKKAVELPGKIATYRISSNGKYIVIRAGERVYVSKIETLYKKAKLPSAIDLSKLSYEIDYRAEWKQIFLEAWRLYRDFFYDPEMHGMNWKKVKKIYATLVNCVTSRNQLNWLLINMVGSLCASHTYIFGGDTSMGIKIERRVRRPASLGADLTLHKSGYYRFSRIFPGRSWQRGHESPLLRPDVDVREGDFLLAINGHDLKGKNYFLYLQVLPGEKIKITVNDSPSYKGARTYTIKPLLSDKTLRYDYWVDTNMRKVLKATGGRVGYMHLRNMMEAGLEDFEKYFRAFRYKEGLIIDARYNGGGYDEYMMIDKLERVLVAFSKVRNFKPMRYPGSVHTGPKVLIVNEYCGSDGEVFTQHFKTRKLGVVVGVRTWGGLIGIINPIKTIDNGVIYQSNVGFYGMDRKWWVENHGAEPDIEVENDPLSQLQGRDPQLEKAIEVALEQLKKNPVKLPSPPKFPKKSRGFPKD